MGKEVKSPQIEKVEKKPGEDIGPEEAKKLNSNGRKNGTRKN